jgi:hypothetical protein
VPDTSILFQIVFEEGGYSKSVGEVQRHKTKLLLDTVHTEFNFVLKKKFRLIHSVIEKRFSRKEILRLIHSRFSRMSRRMVTLFLELIDEIYKRMPEGGVDYLRAFNDLNEFELDLNVRYMDFCAFCNLQRKQVSKGEHAKEEKWLRSLLPSEKRRGLLEVDMAIISEGIAVKKKFFGEQIMYLVTTDKKWAKIIPFIKEIESVIIVIMPQWVGD